LSSSNHSHPFHFSRAVMSRSATRSIVTASTARSSSVASSNASSIDDISSLCDQLHINHSLRDVSVGSTRRGISLIWSHHSVDPTDDRSVSTEESVFSSRYGLGRRWEENSLVPILKKRREVMFDVKQDIQEVEFEGTNRSHEKKGERGTTNLWRKYGALKKLKTVGGYAPKDYKDSKGRTFEFFSEKSRLPAPPNGPELTLNRDKKNPSVVACVKIGDRPAAEEAQLVAKEVDSMVQRMSIEDYINVKRENGKKKNTVAAKLNRSGVSGLFRRFSGTNTNSKRGGE
ncbi:hypothetical protein PENTCL1PPCAC_22376, partial [Pristionchus entomophagus]